MAAVVLGPVVAQIDHHPGVGVATTEIVGGAVPRLLPAIAGVEVPVVGMHVDEFIGVRIRVERAVPWIMRPGDDLPEVAVDGVDEEAVAEGVPVVAPRVRGAVGGHLEPARARRVAPDAPFEPHPLLCRGTRRADATRAGAAAATVEPAVGAKPQSVGKVVVVLRCHLEAVEHHPRRSVGNVVAVAIGHEEQSWWAHQPHAAEPDLHARQLLEVVEKHLSFVGLAVAVAVGEDEHPVAEPGVHLDRTFGIGVVFRNPEPAAGIPGHGDRVLHVWFGGEHADMKPSRHVDRGSGLAGGKRHRGRIFFTVERRRKALGPAPCRGQPRGEQRERHDDRGSRHHGQNIARDPPSARPWIENGRIAENLLFCFYESDHHCDEPGRCDAAPRHPEGPGHQGGRHIDRGDHARRVAPPAGRDVARGDLQRQKDSRVRRGRRGPCSGDATVTASRHEVSAAAAGMTCCHADLS